MSKYSFKKLNFHSYSGILICGNGLLILMTLKTIADQNLPDTGLSVYDFLALSSPVRNSSFIIGNWRSINFGSILSLFFTILYNIEIFVYVKKGWVSGAYSVYIIVENRIYYSLFEIKTKTVWYIG